MTTSQPVPLGPTPTPADKARQASNLAALTTGSPYSRYLLVYPYLISVLSALTQELATAHADCRTPYCDTCRSLRVGLAAIAAADAVHTDHDIHSGGQHAYT